jgi:hypothetical protein
VGFESPARTIRLDGDRRRPVEQAGDPPRGDAYIYALRDEAAYLFAVIAHVCICADCVAKFAEQLASRGPVSPPEPA